jgi:hypothetical protein
MKNRIPSDRRRSDGMALLVTVFVLLLVGAVAVAAIHHSGEEAAAGGRTRATMRNLYAADSGIQLALTRIAQNPPTTVPFSVNLQGGHNVQSRAREDATPQNLDRVGFGPPPPGYQLGAFFNEIYLVNVTSTSPNGASAEIEAKLARLQAGTGAQ